ncbi:MAG: hypothetical protein OEY01_10800 [Desulfobulbaceae bacterium]|nr:hypothetical protein [Desulfobulbaceae bacterium]
MQIARKVKVHNVVPSTPSTEQIVCSPILGDPDTVNNADLCGVSHIHTGFILPTGGIVTGLYFVAQGNTGAGVARNFTFSLCEVRPSVAAASAGMKVSRIIYTGTTTVADNASGIITLASGLTEKVPTMFTLSIKGPFRSTASEKVNAQAGKSAGPVPGMSGVVSGTNVISAATYVGSITVDLVTPAAEVAESVLAATPFKPIVAYLKWRAV